MKNILSFFHLIDEVPGIAGALIGQNRQSGASSITKWVWFKTLSIWFKVFLDHDFLIFFPIGGVSSWVETPIGKFQLDFIFLFLTPSLKDAINIAYI